MTYQEATTYLFTAAPLFQNIGAGAYKEGLSNTHLLDEHFHHPHHNYKTIHVGGTNGKGSTSHTLAAILQSEGYRVGLYTSPHLVDFRERIRVNGQMISEERVIEFVEKERSFFEPLHPSFFELATALAFQYFAEEKVDVAVIEVGLGGRLDCTNIIRPDLSIITNISFDHIQFLGDTLPKIASEKAGIIKQGVPAIIGEAGEEDVREVFVKEAEKVGTSLVFAEEEKELISYSYSPTQGYVYQTKTYGELPSQLSGFCQEKNTRTILTAVNELNKIGYGISTTSVKNGFKHVCELTGLMGRWQTLSTDPLTICDTGHNVGGMQYITRQLAETPHERLHIIIGMVNDKDVNTVLSMLPKDALYYFTQASVKRAMPAKEFAQNAAKHNLHGNSYANVELAYRAAKQNAGKNDLIFVGGSTFIVADMLNNIPRDIFHR
ncbi:MAG: bifunctional folylpolyglutamate synthase/dihydrofolate synthase [Bacteroidaceae bacterium]|nr:bifunctional folylpolyglutamate synthase/dihydrofolate synthase [Bacteroidaceae bacterium]